MTALALSPRQALRRLGVRPGLTFLIVGSLALGLGGVFVLASVVDQLALQPLPVVRPRELAVVELTTLTASGRSASFGRFTLAEIAALRRASAADADLVAFAPAEAILDSGERSEKVESEWVSAEYFQVLGLRAAHGRLFVPGDELRAGRDEAIVVISDRAWQRRFGGARDVLGRRLKVDGEPVTVVGVAPPDFRSLRVAAAPDLFRLAAAAPRDLASFRALARLHPGATLPGVEAALRGAFAAVRSQEGAVQRFVILDGEKSRASERIDLVPGDRGVSDARREHAGTLALVGGMLALVLLALCANLANLLAARAMDEQAHQAIRRALGATRRQLAAGWLFESALLVATGAAGGLAVASLAGGPVLRWLAVPALGDVLTFRLDARLLVAVLALVLPTSLLVGGLAAWESSRTPPGGRLIAESTTSTPGRRRLRGRWALVVVQVALSFVLLTTGALFVRSLDRLVGLDTHLPLEQVLTFRLDFPQRTSVEPAAALDELRRAIERLPGVREVAYSPQSLLDGSRLFLMTAVEGWVPAAGEIPMLEAVPVTARFFEALGLQPSAGRTFRRDDPREATKIVVNRAFAEQYFPRGEALGKRLSFDPRRGNWAERHADDLEIVGVVADGTLADVREKRSPRLFPLVEGGERSLACYVRTSSPPAALAPTIQRVARDAAPEAALYDLRTLAEQRRRLLGREALLRAVALGFAAAALVLAAMGLLAVSTLAVARRRRELAVRLSCGATLVDLVHLVVTQISRVVALGLGLGVALAIPIAGLARGFLFGVTPVDPVSYLAAAAILALVAGLGAALPARRVARIDPATVLRAE